MTGSAGAIPGIILAGGAARRMGGGDKGLLELGRGTVLDSVIARLGPQVDALAINANGDPARFAHLGLPVLPDGVADRPGPLAGILAAMRWGAGRGAARVATVAADTPFLPGDLIARLAARPGLVLAASPGGRHPTFGLWPTDLADDLESALGQGVRKVVAFCDRAGWSVAAFPEDGAFFNVNTPEDLAEARRRCA